MNALPRLPNIVDGFSYDLGLRPLTTDGYPMALAALEPIRRAGSYRPKIYTVPDADTVYALPAYRTIEEQVRVVPGSYLWGLAATFISTMAIQPGFYPHIRITEQGTGIELMSDFISLWGLSWPLGPGWPGLGLARMTLLPEPRPIIEPGHLNVEFANVSATDIARVQLILCCAEPCAVIETGALECRP